MVHESAKNLVSEIRASLPVAAGTGLALGACVVALFDAIGGLDPAVAIALVFAVAASVAWLSVLRAHTVAYLDQTAPVGAIVAGMASVVGLTVPVSARLWVCIAYVALSVGLCAASQFRLARGRSGGGCEGDGEQQAEQGYPPGILAKPLAYLIAYAAVYGVALGLLYAAHAPWLASVLGGWGFGCGLAIAGVAVWGIRLFGTAARGLDVITRFSLVAVVAGFLFLLQPGMPEASLGVLAFGVGLFSYALIRMALDLSEAFALPRWTAQGVALLFALLFAAGAGVGWLLVQAGLVGSDLNGLTIGAVLAIVIVTVYGLSSDRRWTAHELKGIDGSEGELHGRGGTWRSACDAVAEQYGLTRREREVFELLAKGRNAASIEKTLVISNHTVKSHMLNIYRKLGIHSHQELIDAIEEKRAQQSGTEGPLR